MSDFLTVRPARPDELDQVGRLTGEAYVAYTRLGFVRLPERDWQPVPGVTLLAFGTG